MQNRANQLAMEALANPIRRQIVELLRRGETPVNTLSNKFEIARPAISRHLRVLREAGLVTYRSDHNVRLYSVNPDEMDRLRRQFDSEFRDYWRPQGSGEIPAGDSSIQTHCEAAFEVKVATELPISPELAFDYCTREDLFRRWVGEDARNDLRVGGVIEASSTLGGHLRGEYLAIAPGKLVVIRLLEPLDPDENLYTIRFAPSGSGCKIAFTHFVREESLAKLLAFAWGETLKVLRQHVMQASEKG